MKALLSLFGFLFISLLINAQQYQTIAIQSGFNADVIANGVGSANVSTNNDIDGVDYALVSRDFLATSGSTPLTHGLPATGLINSAVASTSGLTYQLASYSNNNSLRLAGANSSGTLTFSLPMSTVKLYVLITSGNGPSTVNIGVNFSDNTVQTFSNISISDWYGGNDFAVQGIGRVDRSNGVLEQNASNPRLYQIPLSIETTNQSKPIKSVTITKSGGTGIPNVFAVSADVYNACEAPKDIAFSATGNSAALSWTAPANAPSSGYQYYLTTSSDVPIAATAPTGNVTAGQTSVLLNNLIAGQTYYFWVRSNCGATKGYWKLKQFNTSHVLPDANGRVFVNANVNGGTGAGLNWTNASPNLINAISAANTNTNIKEIWVEKGTYYPSISSNRDEFFYITRNDLKIYGGFVGTETLSSQRNSTDNVTILSGNIGNLASANDNSYHIIIIDAYSNSIDNSTQIDGFTFQDGNASSGGVLNDYFPRYTGSAILIYPSINNNSPRISNNIFKNNTQFQIGALAIESNTGGTNVTKVEHCSFINNYAKYAGGAIDVFNHYGTAQNVEITDCTFEGNSVDNASQGGATGGLGAAIFTYGENQVLVNRSKFINNKIGTSTQYAGTYKGTAIAAREGSEVTIVNSLVYSDQIYIPFYNNASSLSFINSTVYNPDGGTILATVAPVLNSIQNSIFWMGGNSVNVIDGSGTTVTASNSVIFPKYNVTLNGSNNFNNDPLFTNISTKDFTLQTSSIGINRGDNSFYETSRFGNIDLLKNSRIEEGTIDISAFEKQVTLSSSDIDQEKSIKIYPNPVKDILNFTSDEKILKVEILSMDGKNVLNKSMNDERKLNVQSLSKGLYLIKITTVKESKTIKFIKD